MVSAIFEYAVFNVESSSHSFDDERIALPGRCACLRPSNTVTPVAAVLPGGLKMMNGMPSGR